MTEHLLNGEVEAYLAQHAGLLRRRFPTLATLLEKNGRRLPNGIELATTRVGTPTVAVRRPSGLFYVHSTFNPLKEAERWVEETNSQDSSFLVVIGMGLGYHLECLVARQPGLRLVVIEPDPDVFLAAMVARDQTHWLSHPKLDVLVSGDAHDAATWLLQRYRRHMLHEPRIALWPATSRYAPEFWPALHRQLLDLLRAARVNIVTNRRFSTQWIENFFANVNTFVEDPGVACFFNSFRGRPGIIVSAGPSLERNVSLLSSAKGRSVIIAAGSAINPLLRNGIEPDILVSFDPGEANYRHFEKLYTPNLPLVYAPTIFPRIVKEYTGPRFGAGMDVFPFIDWFLKELGEDKGQLASGPSVANVSWHLAMQMGLNPIILVGQDLAYTGLKSHATGAVHARTVEITPEQMGDKYFEVEGVDGGTVVTDRPLHAMKVWFEQRIRQAPAEQVTIDATEGGAKINGTKIMTLQQALQTYCAASFDPHKALLEIHRQERARLMGKGLQHRLQLIRDRIAAELATIDVTADLGLRDGKQLFLECKTRRLTEQRHREAVRRLQHLADELERSKVYHTMIKPLIPHILESITLLVQQRWQEETALHNKGRELAKQYLVLFGSVKRMGKRVQRLLR